MLEFEDSSVVVPPVIVSWDVFVVSVGEVEESLSVTPPPVIVSGGLVELVGGSVGLPIL